MPLYHHYRYSIEYFIFLVFLCDTSYFYLYQLDKSLDIVLCGRENGFTCHKPSVADWLVHFSTLQWRKIFMHSWCLFGCDTFLFLLYLFLFFATIVIFFPLDKIIIFKFYQIQSYHLKCTFIDFSVNKSHLYCLFKVKSSISEQK